MDFDVLIETPRGSRNKYELDEASGRVRLDRALYASLRFPADYGSVLGTLSPDGDSLDALVIVDEPTFPGCLVRCRALGLLRMRDQAGEDNKILATALGATATDWVELEHVPEALRREIAQFFMVYKDLDVAKWSEVCGWADRQEAEQELTAAYARNQEARQPHPPLV